MRAATSEAAVAAYFNESVLTGTGWTLLSVRQRWSRLPAANDPTRVREHLSAHAPLPLVPERVDGVDVEPVRYIPEVSATIRYRIHSSGDGGALLMGKVQRGGDGVAAHHLLELLHD